MEVYPVATMHPVTKSSGKYDAQFVEKNYLLAENEPDLSDTPLKSQLALAKAGCIYAGASFVNQKLDDRYRSLLESYGALAEQRKNNINARLDKITSSGRQALKTSLTAKFQGDNPQEDLLQQAKEFLKDYDLLVVTLNGFNTALLQRHESIQLNPADPLGFSDHQAFAQEVAAALKGNLKGISPDPHISFMPIRSGALQVLNLRLVDVFGRFVEITPEKVSTAISMEVTDHQDWVRLPPRLSQPARWNFRFLNSAADQKGKHQDSQSHPTSSPVHGWMVPNLLDRSLDFFDPTGQQLGSIIRKDQGSAWKEVRSLVDHPILLEIKHRITHSNGTEFLSAFLEDIEEAMDNIHPDDREGQSAFSVLMGRPMAIVQLGVDLELKGLPDINTSWQELYRDLNRKERSTDDFEQVKFPYRLGEYHQRNDGLVGYWTLNKDRQLSANFSVNDAVSGSLNTDQLKKYDLKTAQPRNDAPILSKFLTEQNNAWSVQDSTERTLFEYLLAEQDNTIKKQDLIRPYFKAGSQVWEALKAANLLTEETKLSLIHI